MSSPLPVRIRLLFTYVPSSPYSHMFATSPPLLSYVHYTPPPPIRIFLPLFTYVRSPPSTYSYTFAHSLPLFAYVCSLPPPICIYLLGFPPPVRISSLWSPSPYLHTFVCPLPLLLFAYVCLTSPNWISLFAPFPNFHMFACPLPYLYKFATFPLSPIPCVRYILPPPITVSLPLF